MDELPPVIDFLPARLLLARQMRGWTKRELARALKVSEASPTYWESGKRTPDAANVQRLAVALRVPVEFFKRDVTAFAHEENVSFRSLRSITARDRDRACAAATIAGEIGMWIAGKYQLPAVNLPDLSDAPPSVAAAAMRTHLKLGHGPAPSMVALLESMGVRCFALGLDLPRADALSAWIDDAPVVLFNVQKSAERSRNDAAHELGHLVLHRHQPAAGESAELQAIEFAAEFLLPSEMMTRSVPRVWSLDSLMHLKRQWGVSAAFMLKRMTGLRLISDWAARAFWQRLGATGFRAGEPGGMPREHSQILLQVVTHLRQSQRGLSVVAKDLCLSIEDVRSRVDGLLPMTAVAGGAAGSTDVVSPANLTLMR